MLTTTSSSCWQLTWLAILRGNQPFLSWFWPSASSPISSYFSSASADLFPRHMSYRELSAFMCKFKGYVGWVALHCHVHIALLFGFLLPAHKQYNPGNWSVPTFSPLVLWKFLLLSTAKHFSFFSAEAVGTNASIDNPNVMLEEKQFLSACHQKSLFSTLLPYLEGFFFTLQWFPMSHGLSLVFLSEAELHFKRSHNWPLGLVGLTISYPPIYLLQ